MVEPIPRYSRLPTKRYVDTTPVKRKMTTILDSLERVSSTQLGALLPVQFAYDGKGRIATITQGTRCDHIGLRSNGFLASTHRSPEPHDEL